MFFFLLNARCLRNIVVLGLLPGVAACVLPEQRLSRYKSQVEIEDLVLRRVYHGESSSRGDPDDIPESNDDPEGYILAFSSVVCAELPRDDTPPEDPLIYARERKKDALTSHVFWRYNPSLSNPNPEKRLLCTRRNGFATRDHQARTARKLSFAVREEAAAWVESALYPCTKTTVSYVVYGGGKVEPLKFRGSREVYLEAPRSQNPRQNLQTYLSEAENTLLDIGWLYNMIKWYVHRPSVFDPSS